jgi:REP element-mobilizing transposase RayT
MPRTSRLDAQGVLHHVMGRGIEKRKIFYSDYDREDFIERMANLCDEGAIDIYAWALLPNHFHLLCKTQNRPLASSMRKLLTGYVVNFNRRHRRHGHLFQNRYKSIVCQEDRYFKELVRYIHLNLLRTGSVNDLKELARSPWSGHSALMGKIKRPWQDTEYVLSYFGRQHSYRKNYQLFIQKGRNQGHRPELVGGGLVRSMGGWSEVLALRTKGERVAYDQRILGDSDFVQAVTTDLDELVKKNLRLSGQRIGINGLAGQVCRKYKISIGELRSGSRRKSAVRARAALSRIAVKELGYSGAEVARYLGVTNSCITRIVASNAGVEDQDLINQL